MMQELQKLYDNIAVPPNLKENILTYCRAAEEKPAPFIVRYAKPLALAAACVVVLFVSLAAPGNLFGGGSTSLPVAAPESSTPESSTPESLIPESLIPGSSTPGSVDSKEDEIPERASTTRGTMMTTTMHGMTTSRKCGVTSTTAPLEGTGGDRDSCEKHVMFYHTIGGRLIDYVGSAEVDAYLKKNGWLNTSHLTREEREQINVVHFLNYFGITKQEFITAMQWGDMLDEKPDLEKIGFGYYNDQYTYREMMDALYSGDQVLIDQVFYLEMIVEPTGLTTTATTTEANTEASASASVLKPINGTTSTRPQ